MLQEDISISRNLDIEGNIALNGRESNDIKGDGPVLRSEDDIEQTRSEARVALTGVQGVGSDQFLARNGSIGPREEGEDGDEGDEG